MFLPHPRVKVSIVGSLRDRDVACSASDHQGSSFESCVWRTVSSQSSHHPQEVLLAQFSLYVHKGGLKPDSFHFKHITNTDDEYIVLSRNMCCCDNAKRRNYNICENWVVITTILLVSISSYTEDVVLISHFIYFYRYIYLFVLYSICLVY